MRTEKTKAEIESSLKLVMDCAKRKAKQPRREIKPEAFARTGSESDAIDEIINRVMAEAHKSVLEMRYYIWERGDSDCRGKDWDIDDEVRTDAAWEQSLSEAEKIAWWRLNAGAHFDDGEDGYFLTAREMTPEWIRARLLSLSPELFREHLNQSSGR